MAVGGILVGSGLVRGVSAGWLESVEALSLALLYAVAGPTGITAVGMHRVLRRLRDLQEVLAEEDGQLHQAADRVDAALRDLRYSAGEDRLELLMRVDDLVKRAEHLENSVEELRQRLAGNGASQGFPPHAT